jgi:hypothetical protein
MKRVGAIVPPFVACANCEAMPGWVTTWSPFEGDREPPGMVCMVRCSCWKAHQAKVVDALKAASQRKPKKDATRVDGLK